MCVKFQELVGLQRDVVNISSQDTPVPKDKLDAILSRMASLCDEANKMSECTAGKIEELRQSSDKDKQSGIGYLWIGVLILIAML